LRLLLQPAREISEASGHLSLPSKDLRSSVRLWEGEIKKIKGHHKGERGYDSLSEEDHQALGKALFMV